MVEFPKLLRPEDQKRIKPDVIRVMMWDDASRRLEAIVKNTEETKEALNDIAAHMIKVPEAP